MKLYDTKTAPNPRRVRVFVAEKGMTIPTVEVDLNGRQNHTAEFRKKNPIGGVPVLELDDGTCIAESVAICRYLEGIQPEPALMGTDAKDRAVVEMWQRRMEQFAADPSCFCWNSARPAIQDLEQRGLV